MKTQGTWLANQSIFRNLGKNLQRNLTARLIDGSFLIVVATVLVLLASSTGGS